MKRQAIAIDDLHQAIQPLLNQFLELLVARLNGAAPETNTRRNGRMALKGKTAKEKPKTYPKEGFATVSEAAVFINVSRDTVYRMIKAGKLGVDREMLGEMRIPWPVLHRLGRTTG